MHLHILPFRKYFSFLSRNAFWFHQTMSHHLDGEIDSIKGYTDHWKLLHTFLEDPKTTWVLPCHQIFGVFFCTAHRISNPSSTQTTKRHLQISYLTCQAVNKIANMQFHSVVWHRKQKNRGIFCAKIMLSHPCSSISSQKIKGHIVVPTTHWNFVQC